MVQLSLIFTERAEHLPLVVGQSRNIFSSSLSLETQILYSKKYFLSDVVLLLILRQKKKTRKGVLKMLTNLHKYFVSDLTVWSPVPFCSQRSNFQISTSLFLMPFCYITAFFDHFISEKWFQTFFFSIFCLIFYFILMFVYFCLIFHRAHQDA